ncbi:DNA-binding transcriptional regulator, AcrR family [Pseudarcicella hirudinis]|uniref:DNA-binding transcriptional regulator, AcrR family n=1 Tax=Pseudarcicella hirudinis TaxID=1079859 RepID=A0A1I5YWH7_9BACT|nr:TetR/AcrR family transcriptional regulator [Pseudarcicella hirudinis]SFQ48579.1 DNA-binding transcriptional regulator, AcrR family [Pseudarcicella hirudinis]
MRTRDENKELIVREKALEMLVLQGLDGFSMQKLAKAAGVSPATLYIYYQDKEDLILKLGIQEGKRLSEATLKNFSPEMSFADGLKIQWINRSGFWLENKQSYDLFELLRNSTYREKIFAAINVEFRAIMGQFVRNAIQKEELIPLTLEVYWSIAFAPLHNLIRFHNDGRSVGGRPYTFSEKDMWEMFALVLKALKP